MVYCGLLKGSSREEPMRLDERLCALEAETRHLAELLTGRNHTESLEALWRYPGVSIEQLTQEYLCDKDPRFADYVELAGEVHRFRVAATEKWCMHLPSLARLLESVGSLLGHVPARRTPLFAARRLRPLFHEFLQSDAAHPIAEYERVSATDQALTFSATQHPAEAFIVSAGLLRPYVLSYDAISARTPVMDRYLAVAAALPARKPIGVFLFLTKEYGPTGPVKDRARFAREFPDAEVMVHACGAPSITATGPPRRACVVYDLVYTGGGVLDGVAALRDAGIADGTVDAIVLSSEASANPSAQARLDAADVAVHEIFPFQQHRSEYGERNYPTWWRSLGHPRRTEPPLYEPVVAYFTFLADRVGHRGRR